MVEVWSKNMQQAKDIFLLCLALAIMQVKVVNSMLQYSKGRHRLSEANNKQAADRGKAHDHKHAEVVFCMDYWLFSVFLCD